MSPGMVFQTYEGHTDQVLAIAWSPDGNYLATGSGDQTVQVWVRRMETPSLPIAAFLVGSERLAGHRMARVLPLRVCMHQLKRIRSMYWILLLER